MRARKLQITREEADLLTLEQTIGHQHRVYPVISAVYLTKRFSVVANLDVKKVDEGALKPKPQ